MEVLIEYSHIFPSSLPSIWQPFGVLYYPSFTCNVLTSHQIRDTRIRLSLYFCPVLIAPELQGRHGVYGYDRGMLSQPLCTPQKSLVFLDHGRWPFFTLKLLFAYGARGFRFGWMRTFQLIAILPLSIVTGATDVKVQLEHSNIFP